MNQAERVRYINLLNQYYPERLAAAVSRGMAGLGQVKVTYGGDVTAEQAAATPTIWDSITGAFKQVVPVYMTYKRQQELAKINRRRMEQGLPPLKPEEMETTAKIEHTVAPETTEAIKKMLPFILAGAVSLVMMLRRR